MKYGPILYVYILKVVSRQLGVFVPSDVSESLVPTEYAMLSNAMQGNCGKQELKNNFTCRLGNWNDNWITETESHDQSLLYEGIGIVVRQSRNLPTI